MTITSVGAAPIRWGMIGCGAVTEIKSGPAFQRTTGSALTAVASRNYLAAKDYARRHGIPRTYENVDELISSDELDAIYIATPPNSHEALALKVAQAGKACCVEKPMALDYEECMRMVSAFAAKGLPLFVSYYRRSLPRFIEVKSWLQQGLIGQIRETRWHLLRPPASQDVARNENWRTNPDIAPGGYFFDLACHGIDLLQFLLGDIEIAHGIAVNQQGLYKAPDAVCATWRFSSGALGCGSWNFGAAYRQDEMQIIGSNGSITFSVFDEEPINLHVDGDERSMYIENPANVQLNHVENIIRHLRGGVAHPSQGFEAAKTNLVLSKVISQST